MSFVYRNKMNLVKSQPGIGEIIAKYKMAGGIVNYSYIL